MKAVHTIGRRLTDQLRAAIKKKFDDERKRLLKQLDGYENRNGHDSHEYSGCCDAHGSHDSEKTASSTSTTEKAEPVQAQVPGTDSGSSAGGVGEPKKRVTKAGEFKQKVFAEMKEWNTVNGIVAATGLTHGQVRGVLSSRKNRMEFQVRMTDGNKWYRLKPKKTPQAAGPTAKTATGGVNQPVPAPTLAAVPTTGAGNAQPQ